MAKCNRRSCTSQDAKWFNHSTRAYYCEHCAHLINKANHQEAMSLYGHDLCTLQESPKMVSPNSLLEAAKKDMIEGRDPKSRDEWALVMNFMVVNIQLGLRHSCCKLLSKIFDMPLSDDDIKEIVEFHSPFAVILSLTSGVYYVKENAEGQVFGHGLNLSKVSGVRDMDVNWFIAGKFDTREEADEFKQQCVSSPRRMKTFQELVKNYG